ncbi:MAG: hypothetical protein ACOY9D_12960 [Pseudomonadota bacterium]
MEDNAKKEDSAKKARSPQFPFISLGKCVDRAKELEAEYGSNSGRPSNIVKAWKYAEKSSGGIQTIAALVAFGLLEELGTGDERKLKLSPLAMTILKDKRPSNAEKAIKEAAIKPKVIQELWAEWGANRPPDHECQSILHLDKNFTEDAAQRLLKVFDDTISYAKLAEEDKNEDNEPEEGENEGGKTPPPPPPSPKGKVPIMHCERVVFAHEIRPNQGFRIIVTGDVDADMVKALEAFTGFQKLLIQSAPPKDKEEGETTH